MNNEFDPNQMSTQTQYQAPLYEKPAPSATTYLVLSIIGLALSTVLGIPLAGIIVCAIAMHKGKVYYANGGAAIGEAKAAKIMSIIGLVLGILGTIAWLIIIVIYVIIIALTLAGGGADYSDMPGYFY